MKFDDYVKFLSEALVVDAEKGPDVQKTFKDHHILNSEVTINVERGHKWDEERNVLLSIKNSVYNYEGARTVIVRHNALKETIDTKEFKAAIFGVEAELKNIEKKYVQDIEKILTKHGFEFSLSNETAKVKAPVKEEPTEEPKVSEKDDFDDLDEL